MDPGTCVDSKTLPLSLIVPLRPSVGNWTTLENQGKQEAHRENREHEDHTKNDFAERLDQEYPEVECKD